MSSRRVGCAARLATVRAGRAAPVAWHLGGWAGVAWAGFSTGRWRRHMLPPGSERRRRSSGVRGAAQARKCASQATAAASCSATKAVLSARRRTLGRALARRRRRRPPRALRRRGGESCLRRVKPLRQHCLLATRPTRQRRRAPPPRAARRSIRCTIRCIRCIRCIRRVRRIRRVHRVIQGAPAQRVAGHACALQPLVRCLELISRLELGQLRLLAGSCAPPPAAVQQLRALGSREDTAAASAVTTAPAAFCEAPAGVEVPAPRRSTGASRT